MLRRGMRVGFIVLLFRIVNETLERISGCSGRRMEILGCAAVSEIR